MWRLNHPHDYDDLKFQLFYDWVDTIVPVEERHRIIVDDSCGILQMSPKSSLELIQSILDKLDNLGIHITFLYVREDIDDCCTWGTAKFPHRLFLNSGLSKILVANNKHLQYELKYAETYIVMATYLSWRAHNLERLPSEIIRELANLLYKRNEI